MEQVDTVKVFGGQQSRFRHASDVLNCDMHFSLFLPPQATSARVPIVFWLSGLTATDQSFFTKAGAQRVAADLGLAIVACDTSPRGPEIPGASDDAWDFGLGAGFYLNATQPPWRDHYQMYDYVLRELPACVEAVAPVDLAHKSILGHSMGGHGALVLALRNPDQFQSVSAFAPISSLMQSPWGIKALTGYLGADRSEWKRYDVPSLLEQVSRSAPRLPILIDHSSEDGFLDNQLKPQLLSRAAEAAGYPIEQHLRMGYDHSYSFIATFIEAHLRFHATYLGLKV